MAVKIHQPPTVILGAVVDSFLPKGQVSKTLDYQYQTN